MLKYLALGLLPVFWVIPGAYLYAACMVFAEQKIYVLPALAALLLFCWYRIGRWASRQDMLRHPLQYTMIAHLPVFLMMAADLPIWGKNGMPGDTMLRAVLSAAMWTPFVTLWRMPLDIGGISFVLLQGLCTILPMAVVFWFGQIGAPFRGRTLILPLVASLLWGFGIEWVYLPLIILWLAWLGYDVWKWRKL